MRGSVFFCWLLLASSWVAGSAVNLPEGPLADLKFYAGTEALDPTEAWSMDGDELVCAGAPQGYLVLREVAGDYELSFEWRWDEPEGGNSGLLIHAVAGTSGFRTWPTCVEVQLKVGMAGDLYAIGQLVGFHGEGKVFVAPGVPVVRLSRSADAEKPASEWNAMRVVAREDEVDVYVNGQPVNRIHGVRPRLGAIALQSEGAPIRFRDITLRSLENAGQ